jgi:hypothetical protein
MGPGEGLAGDGLLQILQVPSVHDLDVDVLLLGNLHAEGSNTLDFPAPWSV